MATGDAARAERALAAFEPFRRSLGIVWQDQQVAPSAHAWLVDLGLTDRVDGITEAAVLAASVEQWQRSERWSRELVRIQPALEDAGIDFTVLKGLGLALLDYGGSDRRAFGDLDLLVRPESFGEARRVLEETGYRAVSMAPELSRDGQERDLHHLILERPPFAIDLHHRLRVHPSFRLASDAGHRERRVFVVLDREFRAPSAADQLLCVVLGMHVDIGLAQCRWRSLLDCLRLLSGMDTSAVDRFFEDRKHDGTLRIVVNVLALCSWLTEGSLGAAVDAHLRRHRGLVVPVPGGDPLELLGAPGRLRAKSWSLRLYDQSRLAAWWSWLRAVPRQALANRRSGRVRPSG